MYEFTFYTFSDREYFETLNNLRIGRQYFDLLRELLPEGWKIGRSDVWLYANSDSTTVQPQGFKIHLSSTLTDAAAMLRRFVPICCSAGTSFKIAADPMLHQFLNSKRYSRGGSGKFATIYPTDERSFLELIEALRQATAEFAGPYILSDKRYKDSKVVFYRYGGHQPISSINPDGSRRMMIRKPDGTPVHDPRGAYFQLPDWVVDPIPSEPAVEDGDPLLHGRYEVVEALNFTNTGGVYRAKDHVTGMDVVIKEARPNTLLWASANVVVDSITALRHEHEMLECLQGLPFVPQAVELYDEWEHTFAVTSFFDGVPLSRLRAMEEFILLGDVGDQAQTERFCTAWRTICLGVLEALDAVHARGVVLGDVSPGNVLFNRESGTIMFIDFESAQRTGGGDELQSFGTHWFNPGFRKRDRRNGEPIVPADDYYACGMLLYNLLCPIQTLFELDLSHPPCRILDYFIESGVPEEVGLIIRALLDCRADEARRLAESWDPLQSIQSRQVMAAIA